MAQEEDKHSLQAKFTAAVKVIRSLPEEGDDNLFCATLSWSTNEKGRTQGFSCVL